MKVLTREEALKIALEKNKDIQKAREYKNSVEGWYIEERAAALPQLTLNGGITRDRDDSLKPFFRGLFPPEKETRSIEVGLSQALYTFGRCIVGTGSVGYPGYCAGPSGRGSARAGECVPRTGSPAGYGDRLAVATYEDLIELLRASAFDESRKLGAFLAERIDTVCGRELRN